MATIKERDGSGKLSFSSKGLTGERIFWLPDYSELTEFMILLSGAVKVDSDGKLTFSAQQEFSPNSGLWCMSASSKGLGKPTKDANGLVTYSGGAEVTAQYETLPYDPKQNPEGDDESVGVWMTENLDLTGEMLVIDPKDEDGAPAWEFLDNDGERFADGSGDVPVNNAPELLKHLAQIDYRVTRHKVPQFSKTKYLSLLGKINNATFGECEAGTLLFLGASASRQTNTDGTRVHEITLNFQYKPSGWNRIFFRGIFILLQHKLTKRRLYEEADFNTLITGK